LLSKTLDLLGHVIERLIEEANWLVLTRLIGLLQQVKSRPNLHEKLKRQVKSLMETPLKPVNMEVIKEALNASSEVKTDSFLAFLLQLTPVAVESLCELVTRLKHPQHRSLVGEALVTLAKDAPDPIASRLSDLKGVWVRDFIVVITRLRLSRVVESLHLLARHEKSVGRKEAVRALGILCPSGTGAPLLGFLQDADGSIRFSVLSLLTSGQYTVPVADWIPIVSDQAFHNRLLVEKRLVFLAMSQTSRAEAIPYFRGLVNQWLWFKRKERL
jgi:hypothetical protein